MLFNSWIFVIFFLAVWSIYILFSEHTRKQNYILLAASLFFYGFWDWRFLFLLSGATVFTFFCARTLSLLSEKGRKSLFITALAVDLGILGFFKYYGFFADSAREMCRFLGWTLDFPTLAIILPVGISFYTFQLLGYLIDVYKGKEKASEDIVNFSLYVAYFPQLVAGPIERSSHLLPILSNKRVITPEAVHRALPLILTGFLKKVMIADGVAPYVDKCFANPESAGVAVLILGTYLFALQIYGDFAGYTDIARGVSLLFGIDLCLNFRQPYLSTSITEFWHRWHISLSSWLRDYLYISLGGNRKGKLRTSVNNMLTMLLGGLWHGAGWNFIVWGGLHGLFLGIHKWMLGGKKYVPDTPENLLKHPFVSFVKILFTFHLVCFAWIFFRCRNWAEVIAFFNGFANFSSDKNQLITGAVYCLFFGSIVLFMDFVSYFSGSEIPVGKRWPSWLRGVVYFLMLVLLILLGENDAAPFIYFQF